MYLVFNSNYVLRGIHLDRLQSAYLCFTFDTASHKLTAAKRYTFNLGDRTFKEGKSFSPASVFYDSASSSFNLVLQVPKFLYTTPDLTSVCPETLILAAPEQLNRWH